MLDPDLQKRFAQHCTDAAFGYSAATTAAYAAFTDQVLNFWSGVLQPEPPKRAPDPWPWAMPMPMLPNAMLPKSSAPVPVNPFAWMLPAVPEPPPPKAPTLPTNPWEAMAAFAEAMSSTLSAMSATPVKPVASPTNPMTAWLAMFPFAAPFAPPTAAWPMAMVMMSSGVPHAVAWPTAEANAAVIDAAEVARRSMKAAFASYQSESGHAAGGNTWPPVDLLTMMAVVPLNIGTMFAAMKMS
jgi:hypothetical protein